jgi:hypothetical protein
MLALMYAVFGRLGAGAVVLSLFVLALAAPALAADEATVARSVDSQGFYLDPGVSITESEASRLVEHASFEGDLVYLVVLGDNPSGGPTIFADDISARVGEGLVVVASPESVGFSGDTTYGDLEIEDAIDQANAVGGDDAEYLTAFIEALTGVPVGEPAGTGSGVTTTVASQQTSDEVTAPATEPSGGGSGFLLFIVIAGGLGLLFWWFLRRSRKKAAQVPAPMSERIVQARAVVQRQLDDVANDVLDLAEEVRVADNPQADEYYERASATYAAASDAFPDAKDAQSIIDLSQQLDEAIWQLDAAEALLDGNPVPPKPVKERIVIEPEPTVTVPERQQRRPTYPSYERRPQRRSSYGGSGLFDILMGVGSVLASTRRGGGGLFGGLGGRSSRSRGGGLFGRRQQPPRQPSRSTRSTPGGGMFGGVGRVDTDGSSSRSSRSSSKRSSSRSSRTRSRVRGGRRRRR